MTLVSPTSIIRNALNNSADVALSALEARTCHSWKMSLDRSGMMPHTEDFAGHASFHLYLRDGSGSRMTDLDGNSFIDLSMGLGTQILGHGVQSVQEAVMAQAARGWQYGLADEGQINLARHIQSASPANERVVFCTSGADAIAYAMRTARGFAGRDVIGVFAGSSHGAHELGAAATDQRRATPSEAGSLFGWSRRVHRQPDVSDGTAEAGLTLTYGHPSAFDHIRSRQRDLAAVIVEPVRAADPSVDHTHWLRELAKVCRETGVLFILDERLTGFRLAFGGAQERFGLIADLVAYGETIGGGLPLGAVAGRADILSSTFGREAPLPSERPMSGNILSIAAGAATLEHLAARRATLYPALEEKTALLTDSFNGFAQGLGIPAKMGAGGSMFRICFKHPAAEAAFYTIALSKGVLMHAAKLGFLSAAHSPNDITDIVSVFQDALTDVRADGLFDPKP